MSITEEQQRHRQMITQMLHRHGLTADDWRFDDDEHRDCAPLGRWRVTEDDENASLYAGDEGELAASVVGAQEHHNERVGFYFTPDEYDSPVEVTPFDSVEPA